jgi:replicative DNA helicase
MPVSVKVSPSDLFVKDKYVSEELRNLAKELNVLLVTAAQLNRASVDEIEFDHSHISGGISKVNSSDNVFGIFTSRHMREQGRYQLQMMKTRSSNGVGQKIELDFDVETLRITDSGEEENTEPNSPTYQSPKELLDKLKTNPIPEPTEKTVHASAESKKLNALLNSLRPNN